MKRNVGLMSTMVLAMMSEDMSLFGRGNVTSSKQPITPEPIKPTPFNKEDGVLKMIAEYKLIKKGNSKKGMTKQTRIKDLKQVSILLDRMHIIEKELNIRGVYIKSIEFEEIEFEESDLLNNLLIKE